eukprot:CAMPEP_0174235792 /NCGR_PEP_ID=MMETSP0417-20130205/5127_1 /TAXON_ID=242541 /ORGANISM="Mayorella sp, Strain BSH-02190019" /LENGTH=342 /DNA_ID=CAMNT_0015314341 /DNA_START=51 /DNA_END=1079 /DNA_ORIENTATION=+
MALLCRFTQRSVLAAYRTPLCVTSKLHVVSPFVVVGAADRTLHTSAFVLNSSLSHYAHASAAATPYARLHQHQSNQQNRPGFVPLDQRQKQTANNLDDFEGSTSQEMIAHLRQKRDALISDMRQGILSETFEKWTPRLHPAPTYPSYADLLTDASNNLVQPGQVGHGWKPFSGAAPGLYHFSDTLAYPDDVIQVPLIAPLFSRDRVTAEVLRGQFKKRRDEFDERRDEDDDSSLYTPRAHCHMLLFLQHRVVFFLKISSDGMPTLKNAIWLDSEWARAFRAVRWPESQEAPMQLDVMTDLVAEVEARYHDQRREERQQQSAHVELSEVQQAFYDYAHHQTRQ